MSRSPSQFTLAVDTREQAPFAFDGILGPGKRPVIVNATRTGLATGDYSILGLEDRIAVERKTKSDLFRTVGAGRRRFERELARMAEMPAPAIVLECDLASVLRRPVHSRMSPASVLNSLIAWSIRHRIPVWPRPDRRFAELVTYRLLQHYWSQHERHATEEADAR